MPTAIISVFTQETFVFAADGRDYDLERKIVVSDSVQKLYPARYEGGDLVYAFSGTDKIKASGSSEIVFDYIPAAIAAAGELENHKFRSLWHYAEVLKDKLWPLPDAAGAALQTHPTSQDPFIIFIAGYFKGRPKRVHVTFPHDGQEPDPPSSDGLGEGNLCGVYPSAMIRIVEDAVDGPLAAYRTKLHAIQTIEEALRASQTFIEALKDPAALTIDPRCVGIGGRVHACTLSSVDGFRWVKEPRQINNSAKS